MHFAIVLLLLALLSLLALCSLVLLSDRYEIVAASDSCEGDLAGCKSRSYNESRLITDIGSTMEKFEALEKEKK